MIYEIYISHSTNYLSNTQQREELIVEMMKNSLARRVLVCGETCGRVIHTRELSKHTRNILFFCRFDVFLPSESFLKFNTV